MLEYFREVESSKESLVVTDHGREVLVIQPIERNEKNTTEGMILNESKIPMQESETQKAEEELLEELRLLATPATPVDENELMAPLPLKEWEVEKKEDNNLWS